MAGVKGCGGGVELILLVLILHHRFKCCLADNPNLIPRLPEVVFHALIKRGTRQKIGDHTDLSFLREGEDE